MWRHVLAALAALLTLLAAAVSVRAPAWPVALVPPAPAPGCTGNSLFEIAPFHDARPELAHAVSAVTLRDGRLRAVWYQGVKELSPDVRIWTATFDGARWSAARAIVDPAETAAGIGRYVRKLGNALIFRDAGGELMLVFASLGGIGGWDGVSLKVTRSRDEGETWSPPRNLTTTPIFNFGTNVRGPALQVAGSPFTLLPTSREFVRSFPEIVLFDERGRVVGKRRIGVGQRGSQPFILVLDARRALAFMRVRRGFTLLSKTDDAGLSWTEPAQTTAPNRDVPVVVTRVGDDLLMVTSKLDDAKGRWSLVFAVSSDNGATWRDIYAQPFGSSPYDIPKYPWLVMGADGLYHVLFTFVHDTKASELMHARFSRDWIAAQAGSPCR